jgi:hypothetical protein
MRLGKTELLAVLGFASLFILGCTHPRAWLYSPQAAVDQPPRTTKAVLVAPFTDERRAENINRVWCYLLPFCPYGLQDLERPERLTPHIHSGAWQFDPAHDIGQAIAEEISRARLFGSVVTEEDLTNPRQGFILRGTIVSTRYEATIVSYGLSVLGSNLWLLGLPMGSKRETLAVRLQLEDQPSRRVYLQQVYRTQADEGWVSLYALPEDFSYDRLLQTLVPTILKDLERALTDTRLDVPAS